MQTIALSESLTAAYIKAYADGVQDYAPEMPRPIAEMQWYVLQCGDAATD